MVKLTRIYTRSGDQGITSLGNGQRVPKSSSRINAIGAVDEANSFLGVALCFIHDTHIQKIVYRIQNDLFDLKADLCMPASDMTLDYQPLRITTDQVTHLEHQIDTFNKLLPPLNSFILPGGSQAAAYLHLCRTIVRRAERELCSIPLHEGIDDAYSPQVLRYINRLSDLLLVISRALNNNGQDDILWIPGGSVA